MTKPTVEDRARKEPGKCVVSGSGDGPIINTGRTYGDGPRKGTIYVAPRSIAACLRDIGWLSPDDADELKARTDRAEARAEEADEELGRLRPLGKAVENLVEKEVEVRETIRKVVRRPNDEEIKDWIDANPGHHLARTLARPEPGSTEEWRQLYGAKGPRSKEQEHADEASRRRAVSRAQAEVERSVTDPNIEAVDDEEPVDAPQRYVTLHGQKVDLDEVLSGTVKEVEAYAEGHPADFRRALLARERHGKDRVTLTEALEDDLEVTDSEVGDPGPDDGLETPEFDRPEGEDDEESPDEGDEDDTEEESE